MTTTSKPTRRNHFTPEFYLSNFVDETGKLLRTFKPPTGELHERRFAPKATGYQEDLYSIERDSEIGPFARPDRIEMEVFRPIDDQSAPVLRRLIAGPPSALDDAERHSWAVFVNSLIERHPQQMRAHFESAQQVAADELEQFMGNVAQEHKDYWMGVTQSVDKNALARNSVREVIRRVIHQDSVVEYFKGMRWVKFHVDSGNPFEFVTSDNAVLVNFGQPRPIYVMSLALSPSDLLVMAKPELELSEAVVQQAAAAHNLQLFRQSEYIYSRSPIRDLSGLLLRYAARSLLPAMPWDRR
jgi:hypothetical protein